MHDADPELDRPQSCHLCQGAFRMPQALEMPRRQEEDTTGASLRLGPPAGGTTRYIYARNQNARKYHNEYGRFRIIFIINRV